MAYLLRPRLAMLQLFGSTVTLWSLFYEFCETFRFPNGLLHSACYHPGPDGLAGYRLALMMFSLGALPVLVRAAGSIRLWGRAGLPVSILGGIVASLAVSWFPMTAWFSGASYLSLFLPIHLAVLFGLPALVSGILAARITRSILTAGVSGLAASLFTVASMWTLSCPGCDRGLLAFIIPCWVLFACLGGLLELGRTGGLAFPIPKLVKSHFPNLYRVSLACVITVGLWTVVAYPFWAPSVLYATALSPEQEQLHLGLPTYRPYVAGYYNSTQYRICCLEIGVSISMTDPGMMGQGNFLMAGMGVQSPNCCIDGWDFGWRADVFLLSGGTVVVSGSSWETCDANANCGGHFWQHLRYHASRTINPPDQSSTVFPRMMWEAGQVNWYYNHTGLSWQRFGSFTPDYREGTYFDIGVLGPSRGRDPLQSTYFFQFGVASKVAFPGWRVVLSHPSFQFQGSWRVMEKAAVIQGDFSYWKAAYRWGGAPYLGATARARALDPTYPDYTVEFASTGGELATNTPLW